MDAEESRGVGGGLTSLSLESREIYYLPKETGLLSNLTDLILDGTGLCTLSPGMFRGLSQLQRLQISHAFLGQTVLPPGAFDGLARLQQLVLCKNRIQRIAPGAFSGLPQLQVLHLRDNPLGMLHSDGFCELAQLQWLDLANCGLTTLSSGAFNGLDQLESLKLDDNPLTETLPADLFHGLSRLQSLSLAHTGLSALPPHLFDGLDQLQQLHLFGNPQLLFFYQTLPTLNNIELVERIQGFFSYACQTPLAGFYQYVAGGPSVEELRNSLSTLDDATKNTLLKAVHEQSLCLQPFSLQWGERHGFEEMALFNRVLRNNVRDQFEKLTPEQKNAVCRRQHVTGLHVFDNIPRLIDAMAAV